MKKIALALALMVTPAFAEPSLAPKVSEPEVAPLATPAPSPIQECGPQADPLKPCQPGPIFPLEQLSQRLGQLQQGVVQALQQQAAVIQALTKRVEALEPKKK